MIVDWRQWGPMKVCNQPARAIQQPNAGSLADCADGVTSAHGDSAAFLDSNDRFAQGHVRSMIGLSRIHRLADRIGYLYVCFR